MVLVVGTGVGVYVWQQANMSQTTQSIKPVSLGYYSGVPKKQYSNEHFSFTSEKEWLFIREASIPPHKYVYYNHINNITQYELTIYVNDVPSQQPVNYVTPVSVQEGKIVPSSISKKCNLDEKKRNGYATKKFENVSYICDLQENSFERIGAGIPGGSYAIPYYSSRGNLNTVGFFFSNHSTNMYPELLNDILTSFKLK